MATAFSGPANSSWACGRGLSRKLPLAGGAELAHGRSPSLTARRHAQPRPRAGFIARRRRRQFPRARPLACLQNYRRRSDWAPPLPVLGGAAASKGDVALQDLAREHDTNYNAVDTVGAPHDISIL